MHKPSHVMCHGFLRAGTGGFLAIEHSVPSHIPGLVSSDLNEHVQRLKQQPWTGLPDLLGGGADRVMIELLLECGIFLPLENGKGNYLQLSGMFFRNACEKVLTSNRHSLVRVEGIGGEIFTNSHTVEIEPGATPREIHSLQKAMQVICVEAETHT